MSVSGGLGVFSGRVVAESEEVRQVIRIEGGPAGIKDLHSAPELNGGCTKSGRSLFSGIEEGRNLER